MTTDHVNAGGGTILERVIRFAVRQRWLVVIAAAAVAALGMFNFTRLPIDAVPDITNVQVQINTSAEGLSPIEVEQRITFPIETAMAGLPRLDYTRSLSRYGLSQVTVAFEDGTNIYFARQLVNERLQEVRASLPQNSGEPSMGPIATGLGEIFTWTVESRPGARKPDGTQYSPMDLREIQDWVIKPQIRTVLGVTEVNAIGGYRKQYLVTPDPARLMAYGLTLNDILQALGSNNSTVGGGFIAHKGEQYLVQTTGRLKNMEEIGEVVIAARRGVPIHVHDVASVSIGKELRTGAATENGEEIVLGTAFMLVGQNSRTVSAAVGKKIEEVNRNLPPGIVAKPVYDRTKLVDATLATVQKNLLEGAVLVIAVLFLLLGNFVAALIVALIIPLSMLFAVSGMVQGRISANLLSLGAIDFGIIVDGAVVMAENIVRRFAHRQGLLGRRLDVHERLQESYLAAAEVARPTLFGVAIIMIVYLPILSLSGIEGKMFRPMAQVVLLALLGSLIFAFTIVPALVAILLRRRVSETQSPVLRGIRRAYLPVLRFSLRRRGLVVVGALLGLAACLLPASRLGSEFVPTLDERDIAIHALRIPGTSLEQAVEMQRQVEKTIEGFPEVAYVFAKIGTAEIATDPMPPSVADVIVIMKPRPEWPDPERPKGEVVQAMADQLGTIPGNTYEYTQPIQMRFNELIAGVRSDVAVKVFGDDLDVLRATATEIAEVLESVPGSADVKAEQVSGLPVLAIDIDRTAVSRYGLSIADVQAVIQTALAGSVAGQIFEGDRRFDITVRLPDEIRNDLQALELLPIPVVAKPRSALPTALPARHDDERTEFVPLGAIATITLSEGPNQVTRENGKRRVVVQANVRGRDLGGFVEEAQERMLESVEIPPGCWVTWGGQFENLIAARTRLTIVVPLALLLIFVLLLVTFGSAKDALLVFSGVPLALTGGVLALAMRGMPFSITAGVGFIALSGVAVLNGVVMVSFIRSLRESGKDLETAILQGCDTRLRPILMTAFVASLGFVPMAIATGTGAEVQRPLATVVIGGILSSTFLTLVVLPALYRLAHRQQEATPEP